jgi:hypothetical protein
MRPTRISSNVGLHAADIPNTGVAYKATVVCPGNVAGKTANRLLASSAAQVSWVWFDAFADDCSAFHVFAGSAHTVKKDGDDTTATLSPTSRPSHGRQRSLV